MHCQRCSTRGMVEIRMNIDGDSVTFRRCGHCEAKTWESTEGPLTLSRVLDKARVRR